MKNLKMVLGAAAFPLLSTTALAAGLDRDVLSADILFDQGTVNRLHYNTVTPSIEGKFANTFETGDAGVQYDSFGYQFKTDISARFSHALIIDRPYGADINYDDADPVPPNAPGIGGIEAHFSSYRASYLLRYKVNENFSMIGGIVGTQMKPAEVSIPARRNYSLSTNSDNAFGYAVGAAYEIPEYAARVSLLYTSAIEHTLRVREPGKMFSDMDITLPQSVTLGFQTGLNQRTLLKGSIRWSDYSEFEIKPEQYSKLYDPGNALRSYESDFVTYNIGLGYKVTDSFSILGGITYEPETDGNESLLGPYNGRTAFNFGGQYTFDTGIGETKIGVGISYSQLGDADGKLSNGTPWKFEDNSALGVGIVFTQSY